MDLALLVPLVLPGSCLMSHPVVCTRCACFCADIIPPSTLTERWNHACELGDQWLRSRPSLEVVSTLHGRPAPLEEALCTAAKLISASSAPQVTGLLGLSVEALREAINLAEQIQASIAIDTTAAWNRAGLDAPDMSATWSAAATTADVVLYWGGNPDVEFPRHRELYAAPRRPDGSLREVVILKQADVGLALQLALLLRGEMPGATLTGVAGPAERLARVVRAATHVQVYCLGLAAGDAALRDVWGGIAAHLRPAVKVTVSSLGPVANGRGALEVLTWLMGVPGALCWLGKPDQHNRHTTWLPSGCDAGLSEQAQRADLLLELGRPSYQAQDEWREQKIPRIVLGDSLEASAEVSIRIPSLDPRLAASVVRGDGVFLTLCGTAAQGVPDPAVEVLQQLRAVLGACVEKSTA
jgi:formylmethanofuran dehydrogenase subunit B